MPVTSHFRTDAEALLPNGQWLPVVVDLREDAGELVIESNFPNPKRSTSDTESTSQPSTPGRNPRNKDNLQNEIETCNQEEILPTASSIRHVEVHKGDEGLGVSIKGGADHNMPITISKIFRGMAADRTRQLFVGDTIVSVNGIDLQNASHEDAVRALRSSGHTVHIEVQYLPTASTTSSPKLTPGKHPLTIAESVPLLSEIGWGMLTTLSPLKRTAAENSTEDQQQTKTAWWRRVCSLRLAGSYLVQNAALASHSRVSSRNSLGSHHSLTDDTANRVIRIHSPDLLRSINLRFSSPPIAGCWLSWLGSAIDRLAERFRDMANAFFSNPNTAIAMNSQMPFAFPGQFWQVGWLETLSQNTCEESNANSNQWQRVFAVVTDKELLTFDRGPSLPYSTGGQLPEHFDAVFKAAIGTWLSKHEIARIPLIFSRLVSNPNSTSDVSQANSFNEMAASVDASCRHLIFGIRVARLPPRTSSPIVTSRDSPLVPVEWRTFRCESSTSLAIWCRAVVAGCHRSVAIINALKFAVIFNGRVCALEISEDRISLVDLEETVQPLYWSKPLSSLGSSSDDGNRLLFFDIQGVGTVDLEMATEADILACSKEAPISLNRRAQGLCVVHSPKPIVFALHSFLSAKLASLGIVA